MGCYVVVKSGAGRNRPLDILAGRRRIFLSQILHQSGLPADLGKILDRFSARAPWMETGDAGGHGGSVAFRKVGHYDEKCPVYKGRVLCPTFDKQLIVLAFCCPATPASAIVCY